MRDYYEGAMEENIAKLKYEIETADAIVIGSGAGLSTSAGLTYSGERFEKYFFDFATEYGIRDIYSGGFYPFPDEETRWAWWARHIYFNRFIDPPKPVYQDLLALFHYTAGVTESAYGAGNTPRCKPRFTSSLIILNGTYMKKRL